MRFNNKQYRFNINIRSIVTVLSLTINKCLGKKLLLTAVLFLIFTYYLTIITLSLSSSNIQTNHL